MPSNEQAGSPWRSAAVSRVEVAATPANHHSAWVTVDTAAAQPTTDGATWEGTPGSSLTLRFRWHLGGTGAGVQTPTFATVEARLPGGAIIGTAWTVLFPAADTEVTQTLRFDDDPLVGAAGAVRAGMIELYLIWGSTGGATPWSADSRGTVTGTTLTTTTNDHEWARGYVRAPVVLSNLVQNRTGLGNIVDANFAYPDSFFTRVTVSEITYRAHSLALAHVNNTTATVLRSDAGVSQTAVQRDYSWTATSGATARVHGAGGDVLGGAYPGSGTLMNRRVQWPSITFGGDQEIVWAATGHLATFTVVDERTLGTVGGIIAIPTIFYDRHLQLNDATLDAGLNVLTGERLAADLGFYAVKVTNNRNEAIVLPGTDAGGELAFSFADSAALVPPTVTADLPTDASGYTQLIAWSDGLPGGAWTLDATLTDAAGTQQPLGELDYTLVAINPFNVLSSHIEARSAAEGTHFTPGTDVTVVSSVEDTRDHERVLASQVTSPKCALVRYERDVGDTGIDGNLQYLNSDTDASSAAWVDWVPQAIALRAVSSKINAASSATIVIDKPAGVVAGDLMVTFVFSGNTATITTLAGWTLLETRQLPSGANGKVGVFYRFADGTEGSTFTWTLSAANQNHQALSAAYSGVDTFQPFDNFESVPESTTLSVTTPVVGALPFGTYALRIVALRSGSTFTWPAGPTERVDQRSGDTVNHRSLSFADELLAGTDVSADTLEVTVDDPFANGAANAMGGTYLLRPLGSVLRTFDMDPSAADPNMYEKVFAATDGWDVNDVRALCYVKVNNVPLFSQSSRELVGAKNPHDKHEFDPLGIFS